MDKTERYIKMSRGAYNLQKQWQPKEGDFITTPNGIRVIGHDWLFLKKRTDRPVWYFAILNFEYKKEYDTVTYQQGKYIVERLVNVTCLLRQDQLQKILGMDCNCNMMWLHQGIELEKFTNWLCDYEENLAMEAYDQNKNYHTTSSWEQVWLQLVMIKKYNKVWTGEIWK